MTQLLTDFHWQRPLWLLGIVAAILIALYLLRGQTQNSGWKQVIDPALIEHLLQGSISRQQRWPLWALAIAIIIASVAMAGPSWEKLPQPIHKTESALVVLLDLSPSMMAQDIKPSRLIRARLKLIDLLKQRKEGLSALIAYAGEAYTVTPLTDDTETIISLLPSLSPAVMPLGGSNTEMALDQALALFRDAGLVQGDILLVTDGATEQAIDYIDTELPSSFRLSVLGVGSDEGAPIPIQNGGFAKDRSGAIVLAKLNSNDLSTLARSHQGRYRTLSNSDSDIEDLVSQPQLLSEQTRELEREFDTWIDRGAWLCLLLIPFAALSFRRGWLLALPLLLIQPEPSYAFGWQDVWQTKDQQGQALLQQDKAAEAAETFERQDWKAAAQYRAGDYEAAAKSYADDDSATGRYNLGNALAKSGKLEEALEAYEQALKHNPDFEDAANNQRVVEELKKQQQQNQEGNSDQQSDQSSDESSDGNQSDSESEDGGSQSESDGSQSDDADGSQSDNADGSQSENADGSQSDSENSQSQSDESQQGDQSQDPKDDQQASSSDQSQESQDPQNKDSSTDQQTESQSSDKASNSANANVGEQEGQLSDEEQQAMEQWLRKIPDDPSGLMRKKFEHQYRQRRLEYQQGTWQPPENEANKRW